MNDVQYQLTGRQIGYQDAVRAGFPANPQAGQLVRTSDGRTFIWPHQSGQGLGDLGQWAEIAGLGVSLFSKLFGGGGPKPDNAARAAFQQQQQQLTEIQSQVEAQSIFQPKYVFLFAIAGLALVMAFRK